MTQPTSKEKVPCPFCGESREEKLRPTACLPSGYVVCCHSCGACGPSADEAIDAQDSADDALRLWDERPAHEPGAFHTMPIAKLTVVDGMVERAGLYAPGLPDGDHDVFPVPLDPDGELRPSMFAVGAKAGHCACGFPLPTPSPPDEWKRRALEAEGILSHNMALANATTRRAQAERNAIICKMREKFSAIEIADMVGLTRQRVHQILNEAPVEESAPPPPSEHSNVQTGIASRGISVPPVCLDCGAHLSQPDVIVTTEPDSPSPPPPAVREALNMLCACCTESTHCTCCGVTLSIEQHTPNCHVRAAEAVLAASRPTKGGE